MKTSLVLKQITIRYLQVPAVAIYLIISGKKITNVPVGPKQPIEITAQLYDHDLKQLYITTAEDQYIFKNNKFYPLINFNHQQNKPYRGRLLATKVMMKSIKNNIMGRNDFGFYIDRCNKG